MVLVAVPGVETVPAAFVAVQPSCTDPEVPAVKVTLVPVVAEVRVPPEMVQAKLQPIWAGTEAA